MTWYTDHICSECGNMLTTDGSRYWCEDCNKTITDIIDIQEDDE